MAFGGLFFALKTPLNKLWWIQKLSYPPHFIHGKKWCIKLTATATVSMFAAGFALNLQTGDQNRVK